MPIDPRTNFTLRKKCPPGSRNPICLVLKNKEDAKEKKRELLKIDEEGKPLKPDKPKPLKPDKPDEPLPKPPPLPTPLKPDEPLPKPSPLPTPLKPSIFTPDIPSAEIPTKKEDIKPPLIAPPRRMGKYTDLTEPMIEKARMIAAVYDGQHHIQKAIDNEYFTREEAVEALFDEENTNNIAAQNDLDNHKILTEFKDSRYMVFKKGEKVTIAFRGRANGDPADIPHIIDTVLSSKKDYAYLDKLYSDIKSANPNATIDITSYSNGGPKGLYLSEKYNLEHHTIDPVLGPKEVKLLLDRTVKSPKLDLARTNVAAVSSPALTLQQIASGDRAHMNIIKVDPVKLSPNPVKRFIEAHDLTKFTKPSPKVRTSAMVRTSLGGVAAGIVPAALASHLVDNSSLKNNEVKLGATAVGTSILTKGFSPLFSAGPAPIAETLVPLYGSFQAVDKSEKFVDTMLGDDMSDLKKQTLKGGVLGGVGAGAYMGTSALQMGLVRGGIAAGQAASSFFAPAAAVGEGLEMGLLAAEGAEVGAELGAEIGAGAAPETGGASILLGLAAGVALGGIFGAYNGLFGKKEKEIKYPDDINTEVNGLKKTKLLTQQEVKQYIYNLNDRDLVNEVIRATQQGRKVYLYQDEDGGPKKLALQMSKEDIAQSIMMYKKDPDSFKGFSTKRLQMLGLNPALAEGKQLVKNKDNKMESNVIELKDGSFLPGKSHEFGDMRQAHRLAMLMDETDDPTQYFISNQYKNSKYYKKVGKFKSFEEVDNITTQYLLEQADKKKQTKKLQQIKEIDDNNLESLNQTLRDQEKRLRELINIEEVGDAIDDQLIQALRENIKLLKQKITTVSEQEQQVKTEIKETETETETERERDPDFLQEQMINIDQPGQSRRGRQLQEIVDDSPDFPEGGNRRSFIPEEEEGEEEDDGQDEQEVMNAFNELRKMNYKKFLIFEDDFGNKLEVNIQYIVQSGWNAVSSRIQQWSIPFSSSGNLKITNTTTGGTANINIQNFQSFVNTVQIELPKERTTILDELQLKGNKFTLTDGVTFATLNPEDVRPYQTPELLRLLYLQRMNMLSNDLVIADDQRNFAFVSQSELYSMLAKYIAANQPQKIPFSVDESTIPNVSQIVKNLSLSIPTGALADNLIKFKDVFGNSFTMTTEELVYGGITKFESLGQQLDPPFVYRKFVDATGARIPTGDLVQITNLANGEIVYIQNNNLVRFFIKVKNEMTPDIPQRPKEPFDVTVGDIPNINQIITDLGLSAPIGEFANHLIQFEDEYGNSFTMTVNELVNQGMGSFSYLGSQANFVYDQYVPGTGLVPTGDIIQIKNLYNGKISYVQNTDLTAFFSRVNVVYSKIKTTDFGLGPTYRPLSVKTVYNSLLIDAPIGAAANETLTFTNAFGVSITLTIGEIVNGGMATFIQKADANNPPFDHAASAYTMRIVNNNNGNIGYISTNNLTRFVVQTEALKYHSFGMFSSLKTSETVNGKKIGNIVIYDGDRNMINVYTANLLQGDTLQTIVQRFGKPFNINGNLSVKGMDGTTIYTNLTNLNQFLSVYVYQFAPFQELGVPKTAQGAFDSFAMDQTQTLTFQTREGQTFTVPVSYIVQNGTDGIVNTFGSNQNMLSSSVFSVTNSNGTSVSLQPNQMDQFWTYIQLHAPAHYLITDAKVMGIERGIGEGETYKDGSYMYFEYTNVGGYDAALFKAFPNKIVRVDGSGHYTVGVPLTRFSPTQIQNLLGATGEGIKFALKSDDETPEQEDGQAAAEGETQAEAEGETQAEAEGGLPTM